jgi:chondroitin AC lyase
MFRGYCFLKFKYTLFIFLSSLSFAAMAQNEIFSTIKSRINADLQNGVNDSVLRIKIAKDSVNLNADGSWKDVNYADVQYEPLKRIKDMAIAYIRPSNKLFNDRNTYLAIVSSLQNWLVKNPKNKNWWYNDIYYPQATGQILLLMRDATTRLPKELENGLILRMQRKLKPGDGANTCDEALHYLYRACLTHHKSTLDSAAKYLFEPISITNGKEGVQVDGSYYQHGKQQAIASYGRVFAGNSVNAAFYLRSTEYALSQKQFDILVNYLKNTFLKTIRGSFFDFNVRGRGISRKDSLDGNVSGMVSKIKIFNAENEDSWNASIQRTLNKKPAAYKIIPTHHQYWKSGYTLHLRRDFTFSVQAVSNRTLRTERGNNENILGKFLPDGATNIQRTGAEYANIMPIWEWDKIPGTTSRDYTDDEGSTIKQDWGIPGTTEFSGGVSDGTYGVSTYALNYDSVQAKKAWFFFDKEVVCLGAGISSQSTENITTTVNQAWLKSNISITTTHRKDVLLAPNSNIEISKVKWLLQDSIGYFFPQGGNLNLSNHIQNGNWYRINHFQSKDEVSGKVFKAWFNHGSKPQKSRYAYIVVPGISSVDEMKKYNPSMIQILENTATVQAVKHKGLNMLQIVFYTGGALRSEGIFVKVDKACTIYLKGINTKEPVLYIADPAQEYSSVHVAFKLPGLNRERHMDCTLPVGALAGSTTQFKIKE